VAAQPSCRVGCVFRPLWQQRRQQLKETKEMAQMSVEPFVETLLMV
jgi:hypothetical protein